MTFLERVVAARRADAERRRAAGALSLAREAVAAAGDPRDFYAAIEEPGMSLIGEIKRASPSAGDIVAHARPARYAQIYEAAGASALSVLTEPDHFKGSLEDLRAARDAVSIPALRKDFLCDPLHVWEARACGADAVLLIVAALEQTGLVALLDLAETLGLAALVEVHTADELDRALRAGARLVGINTRDLSTLKVDPTVVKAIRPMIPPNVLVVAESGVSKRSEVEALEALECDGVLIGEALMRAPDPGQKVRELLGIT
ncbi:MAG: indole-3-glycerol phosphate synthase TrpC [Actinomycetota bacterium]|nr:indole-3-glycerol phosphate synthase TrpC [Actinomycetota bacterium]